MREIARAAEARTDQPAVAVVRRLRRCKLSLGLVRHGSTQATAGQGHCRAARVRNIGGRLKSGLEGWQEDALASAKTTCDLLSDASTANCEGDVLELCSGSMMCVLGWLLPLGNSDQARRALYSIRARLALFAPRKARTAALILRLPGPANLLSVPSRNSVAAGGCLCGSLRYEVQRDVLQAGHTIYCHCRFCQLPRQHCVQQRQRCVCSTNFEVIYDHT